MVDVVSIDFHEFLNSKEHRTDQYELIKSATPILRRGQKFRLGITFGRPFVVEEQYDLFLIFNIGSTPVSTKGTQAVLQVKKATTATDNKQWSVGVISSKKNTLVMEVQISAFAPVGGWSFSVFTKDSKSSQGYTEYKYRGVVYILFNPWCPEDGVFLGNDEKRTEYVLNDVGKIYKGTYRTPEILRWEYGQFHKVVLPVIMVLLDRSDLPHADRWDPIRMARAIAALGNGEDDFGLLQGEWANYSGGVSPYAWTGTVPIMKNFVTNGYSTVKFAQCWVFAGSVTTICRALGIPARTITNFQSAHDTNQSLTLDIHSDANGERLDHLNVDSCWNFHCWTDVWMSRPDLPSGYGGWQIIDATPQEPSNGKYLLGPTSVAAVRRGDVGLQYDAIFAYTEVNGDLCYFKFDEKTRNFVLTSINEDYVGRQIVTKKIGPVRSFGHNIDDMEDITVLYKYSDKTEERAALYNAIRLVPRAQAIYRFPLVVKKDVQFRLLSIDSVKFGDGFEVVVNAKNISSEIRTVTGIVSTSTILYTGVTIHQVKKTQINLILQANKEETFKMLVKAEDYQSKLEGHGLLKRYVIANVKETSQVWVEDDSFPVSKPAMNVTVEANNEFLKRRPTFAYSPPPSAHPVPGRPSSAAGGTVPLPTQPAEAPAGETEIKVPGEAVFSFLNPMPIVLTDCTFSIQVVGSGDDPEIIKYRDVQPNEDVTYTYSFSLKEQTTATVICTFASKQLNGITGYKEVMTGK